LPYIAHAQSDNVLLGVDAEAVRVVSEVVLAVAAANLAVDGHIAGDRGGAGTNIILAADAGELVGEAHVCLRLDIASRDIHLTGFQHKHVVCCQIHSGGILQHMQMGALLAKNHRLPIGCCSRRPC